MGLVVVLGFSVGVVVWLGTLVVGSGMICCSRPDVWVDMPEGAVEQATSRLVIRMRMYSLFIEK